MPGLVRLRCRRSGIHSCQAFGDAGGGSELDGSANTDVEPSRSFVSFDSRDYSFSDALDYGREALKSTYQLIVPKDDVNHWYQTDAWTMGPLLLSRNTGSGGHELVRECRHLSSNPGNYLKLQIFQAGGGSFSTSDKSLPLDAGSVHLINQSSTYRQKMSGGENWTVLVPTALLDIEDGVLPTCIRFPIDTGEGNFLAAMTKKLFEDARSMPLAVATGAARAYVAMLQGLLDWRISESGGESIRDVRLSSAKRVIASKLSDPNLSVETIQAVVGASRATLFRDFAPIGGIHGYIRERRLEHAYRELALRNDQRGVVSTVWEASGFSSLSDFSRAFRNRYGVPPSEIVGLWSERTDVNPSTEKGQIDRSFQRLQTVYEWGIS